MKYKKRTSPPSAWTLQGKSAQFGWGPSPCKNTGQKIFRELPVCQHDHLLLTWGRSWRPSAGPSRRDSCKPPPPSPWWHPPPSFMLPCWWWSMSMTRPDVVLPEKLVAIRIKYFESPLCPDGWRGSNAVQEKNFIYCCYAPSSWWSITTIHDSWFMCRWQLSLLRIYGIFLILWLGFHCASIPIHGWLINKEWWEQMRKETWLLVKQSKETYSHLRTKKRFKSCLNVREESMFEPERREHVEELLESHQLAGVGREHLTDPLCKRVHLSLR